MVGILRSEICDHFICTQPPSLSTILIIRCSSGCLILIRVTPSLCLMGKMFPSPSSIATLISSNTSNTNPWQFRTHELTYCWARNTHSILRRPFGRPTSRHVYVSSVACDWRAVFERHNPLYTSRCVERAQKTPPKVAGAHSFACVVWRSQQKDATPDAWHTFLRRATDWKSPKQLPRVRCGNAKHATTTTLHGIESECVNVCSNVMYRRVYYCHRTPTNHGYTHTFVSHVRIRPTQIACIDLLISLKLLGVHNKTVCAALAGPTNVVRSSERIEAHDTLIHRTNMALISHETDASCVRAVHPDLWRLSTERSTQAVVNFRQFS